MVIKNGPHWWASDRVTLEFGVEVLEVGGIGFRFASNISVEILKSGGLAAGKYYDPVEAAKRGDARLCSREAGLRARVARWRNVRDAVVEHRDRRLRDAR